jgi:Tol biopolymer transport system component
MAISPDGNELFYTVEMPQNVFSMIIYMGKDSKGNWSSPEVAPFSGNYMDLEPAFSPDGKKLFFVSNRPLQGDTAKDFDIWCLTKTNGQWSNPINLQAPVNTSANEFYPSIAANGNLYFTAERPNGKGKEDIHVARWEHDHYLEPVSLDSGVNSALYEFNAYVSPDEQFIIFSSFGRKDDQGKGDLYMSIKDAHGNWQPAKNLSIINSARLDYCPFVSFDKKILFFTSEQSNPKGSYPHKKASYSDLIQLANGANNGSSNIYWISFDKVMESIK